MEEVRMAGKLSHLIKSVAARLGQSLNKRRHALRLGARFEARLPFLVTLLGTEKGSQKGLPDTPALVGFTRNLSETGMTLLLPSMRIGNAYLTDAESYLEVKLELPGGAVAIRTASVRFEQLPRREAGCAYLLAVRIVNMQNDERDRYVAYLKTIGSKEKRTPGLEKAQTVIAGSNNTTQTGKWEALTPASVSKAFEQFVRE
jgi:hypothetical protein